MRWFFQIPLIISFGVATIITISYLYEMTFGYGRASWFNVLTGVGFMTACVGFRYFYKFIEKLGEKIEGKNNKQ